MSSRIIFRDLIGAVVIGALGTTFWFATRPPPLTIQGEVSSDRVDVSSRIAGRVEKLNVNVGDAVKRSAP
jgi:HlyD family secretion protein